MNHATKALPIDLSTIPWPQKGDNLVTSDGDPLFLVQTDGCERWEMYVSAYRMAAEMLVERTDDMTLSINWLVLPMWYLYRHYLELRLKSLVWDGDMLDKKPPTNLRNHHSLMRLWGLSRPAIVKWQADCPKGDLDAVEEILKQLEAKDPNSQAARYTSDTKGSPSSLLGIEINVKTFAATVTKAANFLDACSRVFYKLQRSPD